jgi:hypothetical protein
LWQILLVAPIISARMRGYWGVASVTLLATGLAWALQADACDQAHRAFAPRRYSEAAQLFARAETDNTGKSDALLMEGK